MIALITTLTLAQGSIDWHDIVQNGFNDAKFVARAVKGDQKELKKINDDFGQSFRFTKTTAYVKEPFMLRMESEVDDTKLMYVLNGGKKVYKLGKLSYTDNVEKAPGKRQTLFDFGILTPSLFKDFYVAKYIRTDSASGDYVFDVTYNPKYDDTTRYRIWVDKDKKIVNKRVWFAQEGHQRATFIYENAKKLDGIWFPTRCTVKNVDDKVAGITEYEQISINPGLPDSLFKV